MHRESAGVAGRGAATAGRVKTRGRAPLCRRSLVAALAALFATLPAVARAQVRGQVIDTEGQPLPGVLVELWDTARRVGGDGTDASGYFEIPAPRASGPRVLFARGIGLDPLRRPLEPRDSVVILTMRPHALRLDPATVTAGATLCPDSDDTRARALWQRAASHYDVSLSAYGVQSDVQLFAALVPPDSLGMVDTTRLEATFVGGRYTPLAFATRYRSAPNYYAVRAGPIHVRRYDRWNYQSLESSRAWHFADGFFAYLNRLSLEPEPSGDTAIAFCSVERDRPAIRGRLHLAPDSTLASVEWEFVTPPPHEEAGGRVVYAPADPRWSGQPLVPIAGLFWRRVQKEMYQESMEYRQWFRCETTVSCARPVPLGPPPTTHAAADRPTTDRARADRALLDLSTPGGESQGSPPDAPPPPRPEPPPA